MDEITVKPEQEPEQPKREGFGRLALRLPGWGEVDTVLGVESGPEGNGAKA